MTFVLTQMTISMTFVIMRLYNSILSVRIDWPVRSFLRGSIGPWDDLRRESFFQNAENASGFFGKGCPIAPDREFLARVVDFRFRL